MTKYVNRKFREYSFFNQLLFYVNIREKINGYFNEKGTKIKERNLSSIRDRRKIKSEFLRDILKNIS